MVAFVSSPIRACLGIYLFCWIFRLSERENGWVILFDVQSVRFCVLVQFPERFVFSGRSILAR